MSKTKGSIVIKFSSLGLSLITIFLALLFLFAFGEIQGSEKKPNYLLVLKTVIRIKFMEPLQEM